MGALWGFCQFSPAFKMGFNGFNRLSCMSRQLVHIVFTRPPTWLHCTLKNVFHYKSLLSMYLLFYFCVPFVCVWLVLYRSRFVVVGFCWCSVLCSALWCSSCSRFSVRRFSFCSFLDVVVFVNSSPVLVTSRTFYRTLACNRLRSQPPMEPVFKFKWDTIRAASIIFFFCERLS